MAKQIDVVRMDGVKVTIDGKDVPVIDAKLEMVRDVPPETAAAKARTVTAADFVVTSTPARGETWVRKYFIPQGVLDRAMDKAAAGIAKTIEGQMLTALGLTPPDVVDADAVDITDQKAIAAPETAGEAQRDRYGKW